jgi:hypothetical protein
MESELAARIEAMFAELHADGYDGKHEKVREMIRATRMALAWALRSYGPVD